MQKILVVGYGSIGKRHVKNLLKFPNISVIICTKQKFKSNKRKKFFRSIEECLNEKPTIAFITNESSYHIKTAIKLAESNLHLFIEKPLSDSTSGTLKLKKLIDKKKLITQLGCNLRFYPAFKKIKELVDNEIIGKPISVQVETGSYLPDWHPYEDYRNGYAAKKELGGGILLTAIHEIDYLYWIFGKISDVLSITGKFSNLKINTDDLSVSLIKFKNNVIGEIHLDYFQRPFYKSCKIRCVSGIVYWNSDSNSIKIYNSNLKKWFTKKINKNYKLTSKQANLMYMDEIKYFLNCVKNNKKTFNNFDHGLDVLKIALAIRTASSSKKTISVKY